jgi:protocatechuate 3,4-dioxygenase beta subunit
MGKQREHKGTLSRRQFVRTTASGVAVVSVLGCGNDDEIIPMCGLVTADNIEGPFFTPSSPERTSLVEQGVVGTLLTVSGQVMGDDCEPLAGATLDFWQADDSGAYDDVGFILRGHQFTDDQGFYLLETIVPGHYLNGSSFRPAHIHVKASAPGHPLFTTQLYFEGDPYNSDDAFIVDSLIMPITDDGDGGKLAIFDFLLAPSLG